jgi:hypothetical protein
MRLKRVHLRRRYDGHPNHIQTTSRTLATGDNLKALPLQPLISHPWSLLCRLSRIHLYCYHSSQHIKHLPPFLEAGKMDLQCPYGCTVQDEVDSFLLLFPRRCTPPGKPTSLAVRARPCWSTMSGVRVLQPTCNSSSHDVCYFPTAIIPLCCQPAPGVPVYHAHGLLGEKSLHVSSQTRLVVIGCGWYLGDRLLDGLCSELDHDTPRGLHLERPDGQGSDDLIILGPVHTCTRINITADNCCPY